jgi:hypothetical protein
MTNSEKLNELHQQSIEKQKEFVKLVAEIRNGHPNVPDEKYHLRDRLYKGFVKDLEDFKKLAKYLETNSVPIEDPYDENYDK